MMLSRRRGEARAAPESDYSRSRRMGHRQPRVTVWKSGGNGTASSSDFHKYGDGATSWYPRRGACSFRASVTTNGPRSFRVQPAQAEIAKLRLPALPLPGIPPMQRQLSFALMLLA